MDEIRPLREQDEIRSPRDRDGIRSLSERDEIRSLSERDEIQSLRERIDALDLQLVGLLNARMSCALEIGLIKQRATLPIYEPDREATVLANVTAANRGPLDTEALRRVFERIIDEARRLQRPSSHASAEPPQR